MASDFCALLDHLKIQSANVLGWSDGGIDGILMAMKCPDKIKKLAVSGANVVPDSSAVSSADITGMKNFQSIPSASLCIFPDSNHGVCQQHPELFNETVFAFFSR